MRQPTSIPEMTQMMRGVAMPQTILHPWETEVARKPLCGGVVAAPVPAQTGPVTIGVQREPLCGVWLDFDQAPRSALTLAGRHLNKSTRQVYLAPGRAAEFPPSLPQKACITRGADKRRRSGVEEFSRSVGSQILARRGSPSVAQSFSRIYVNRSLTQRPPKKARSVARQFLAVCGAGPSPLCKP